MGVVNQGEPSNRVALSIPLKRNTIKSK